MKLKKENSYSFPLEKKTIMYALNSNVAFVLFLVDLANETVYYLAIQEYFIANKELFKRIEDNNDDGTLNVHISCEHILSYDDHDLQEIAKSTYVDGPGEMLRRYN